MSGDTPEHICPSCDLVITDAYQLTAGVAAHCPRCHSKLRSSLRFSFSHQFALALTCLITLILANTYPLLSFEFFGIPSNASLLEGTLTLINNGFYFVGACILLASVVAPFCVFSLILLNSVSLQFGWRWRGLATSLHFQSALTDWSMLEVYLVSFVVALVKLMEIATIDLGWGLWCICITLILSTRLLQGIEEAEYWSRYEQIG